MTATHKFIKDTRLGWLSRIIPKDTPCTLITTDDPVIHFVPSGFAVVEFGDLTRTVVPDYTITPLTKESD